MIEWRRVVQQFPCLVCGAAPGRRCITATGIETYQPHYLRSRAASEAQWKSPEDAGHPLTDTRMEQR